MSKKHRSAKQAVSAKGQDSAEPKKDNSPYVFTDKEKLGAPLKINMRYRLNEKQQRFFDTAMNKDTRLVMCDGLWGSSKTFLSVYCALELLNRKAVDSIIYLRAPVEAGEGIGFLPGSLEEKINPYAEPLFEKLHELLDKPSVQRLEKEERVEVVPPGFIRGRSWACKAVIVDEAANFDRSMLELILSRIGPFCKVFVIGSHHQSDIKSANGFMEVFRAFDDADSKDHGIHTFEFNDEADIVRSAFVRFVMRKLGVLPPLKPSDEPMFINARIKP